MEIPRQRLREHWQPVSPDKIHYIGKTGVLPYVRNDGKRLEISIFPRLWNHGIIDVYKRQALGLPDTMVYRQPFPGPGLGVRCLGAITRDRLNALRESDAILREEFDRAGLTSKVWQFFTIVPDMRSTGVRDGARVFDWPVIIRAVNTVDAMTATVPELPWALLKRVTDRVLSEVPGVCRVLYDLSPKPVGTIEWE